MFSVLQTRLLVGRLQCVTDRDSSKQDFTNSSFFINLFSQQMQIELRQSKALVKDLFVKKRNKDRYKPVRDNKCLQYGHWGRLTSIGKQQSWQIYFRYSSERICSLMETITSLLDIIQYLFQKIFKIYCYLLKKLTVMGLPEGDRVPNAVQFYVESIRVAFSCYAQSHDRFTESNISYTYR